MSFNEVDRASLGEIVRKSERSSPFRGEGERVCETEFEKFDSDAHGQVQYRTVLTYQTPWVWPKWPPSPPSSAEHLYMYTQ